MGRYGMLSGAAAFRLAIKFTVTGRDSQLRVGREGKEEEAGRDKMKGLC